MYVNFIGAPFLCVLCTFVLQQGLSRGQLSNNTTNITFNGTTLVCAKNQFICMNKNCVNQLQVCDGADTCGDGSDENEILCKKNRENCWPWQSDCIINGCKNGTFQCDNGKCINLTDVCDKKDHCGDGTDEMRYTTGFKCPLGRHGDLCVLPQRHLKDRYAQCNNDADESVTVDRKRRLFQCFDKSKIISNFQQCDKIIDCPDLSDECPCENGNTKVCKQLCRKMSKKEKCTFQTILCSGNVTINPNQICDGKVDCPHGLDERYCSNHSSNAIILCPADIYNTSQKLARLCDGRPECFDLSDECNSRCKHKEPGYCSLNITEIPYQHQCNTSSGSTFNLTVEHICDGEWSPCNIPSEEINCTGRHYCKHEYLISIDESLKCNGYSECEDESDEKDCSNRFSCEGKRFGPESVPMQFVHDGVPDCQDGEDECSSDLDNRPIGSRTDLLDSKFFQVWVWLVGLSCIFGNSYIIADKLRQIKDIQKSDGLAKCNHFLVFNLALADSLMGLYLLGIAFTQVLTSGSYCRHDVTWRTGPVCFWLGATAVVSSEASLFMLTILTTLRLSSVHFPLKFRNMKVKWIAVPTLFSWFLATLIGFMPYPDVSRESFTRGAFVKSKFISSRMVDLSTIHEFAVSLSRVTTNGTAVRITPYWSDVAHYLRTNYRGHGIASYYGYYSEYSVCMPNFYVTTKEKMWGYSFAIILVNFVIFIYIAAAYFAIYKRATRQNISSTADNRKYNLQTKVIRIIISDMLCWVPICIMAFLTLSRDINPSGSLYAATAIIILPINSVLNPFLYSNILDILWRKKSACMKIFTEPFRKSTNNSQGTELSVIPHKVL